MNTKIKNVVVFAAFSLLSMNQAIAQNFSELDSQLSSLRGPVRTTLGIIVGLYAFVGIVNIFIKYQNDEEREAKKKLVSVVVSLVIWFVADALVRVFIPA